MHVKLDYFGSSCNSTGWRTIYWMPFGNHYYYCPQVCLISILFHFSGGHVSSPWHMSSPTWKQSIFWQCPQVSPFKLLAHGFRISLWQSPKSYISHLARQQLHLDKQWHWSLIMLFLPNHFRLVKHPQQDSARVLALLPTMLFVASARRCKAVYFSFFNIVLIQ